MTVQPSANAPALCTIEGAALGAQASVTVTPTWGAAGSGTEGLWGPTHAQELGGREFDAEHRLESEVGYGLAGPRRQDVVTPYAGLSLGETGDRTWRSGNRWQVAPEIALGLEASGGAGGDADQFLMLRAQARF